MNEIELILAKLKIVVETEENGLYLCNKKDGKLLLDYINNLKEIPNKIKFYIEQSDIKNMLWGNEILKMIGDDNE
jgi:hypothetical protein